MILPGTVSSIIKSGKPFPAMAGASVSIKDLESGKVKTAYDVLSSPTFARDWDAAMQGQIAAMQKSEPSVAKIVEKVKKSTSKAKIPSKEAVKPIVTKKEPTSPTATKSLSDVVLPATIGYAAATIPAGQETPPVKEEGKLMGAYNKLDDWLAGVLPGGVPVDVKEAAIKGLAGYAAYRLGGSAKSALSGMSIGSVVSRIFGGGGGVRKVRRARIGVRRSDYKRVNRMMNDLRRLDKFVNKVGIADLKFRRMKA